MFEIKWRFKECEIYNTSLVTGRNKRKAIQNFINLMSNDDLVIGKIIQRQK